MKQKHNNNNYYYYYNYYYYTHSPWKWRKKILAICSTILFWNVRTSSVLIPPLVHSFLFAQLDCYKKVSGFLPNTSWMNIRIIIAGVYWRCAEGHALLRALQLLLILWIKNQCSYSHCTDKETKAQRGLRPGSCWIELDLTLFNCRAGFNQVRMPSRLKSLTAMLSCRALHHIVSACTCCKRSRACKIPEINILYSCARIYWAHKWISRTFAELPLRIKEERAHSPTESKGTC